MVDYFDYDEAEADARELILEFGQSGTITRTTTSGSSYNPTVTEADYTCTLVVLEYENRQIDGTRIRTGDKMVYVSTSGLSIEPTEADQITIGDVVHEVVSVMPLNPAGTAVYWELQCRK